MTRQEPLPPNQAADRDLIPDALRGFALFGIILVNVAYFGTDVANGMTGAALGSTLDEVAAFIVVALAQGKFYLLFSFLFGYATLYALKRPVGAVARWRARSLALIVFGVLHATLLFIGDILLTYGLLGLLLIPFLRAPAARLRRATRVTFTVSIFVLLALVGLVRLAELAGVDAQTTIVPAFEASVQGTDVLAATVDRTLLWLQTLPFVLLLQGPLAFAAFLVGLRAARVQLLSGAADGVPVRRWLVWGFGVGLPLQLLLAGVWLWNARSAAPLESVTLASTFAGFLVAPLVSLAYVAGVVALARRWPSRIAWLTAPGRWALSVYLMQSVLLVWIFSGWGLGLFGRLPYAAVVLIGLLVAAGLALAARVAVSRLGGRGPFERVFALLIRRLTFGRR